MTDDHQTGDHRPDRGNCDRCGDVVDYVEPEGPDGPLRCTQCGRVIMW